MSFHRVRRLASTVLLALAGLSALSLSGCGFKMRGFDLDMPFTSMAIQGDQGVAEEIRHVMYGQPNVRLVQKPADAEVVLVIVSQTLDRVVTAFSSAGRPREIQLRMRVGYRINDSLGTEISPLQEINQARDLTVNESEVLALATAESFMLDDMQRDISRQLIRRLRAAKLPN